MVRETENVAYEEMISKEQDLTFSTLKNKYEVAGFDFNDFKMTTSGFLKEDKYTNLAFIFSDQYDIDTKVGIYKGLDRKVFKLKKEFGGSIIRQIDQVLDYFYLCDETRIVITGAPQRKEYPSYYNVAAREAILNCYCHREYSRHSNIKIEFFDDKCEIISHGELYDGLSLEDALE